MTKKHRDLIVAALIVLSIVMYDVVIDLVFSVLHLIFEVLHIMFEWFELGIEHAVEHLFHTSRHDSQIITFYILLLIACMLLYWLWRILPGLYKQLMELMWQAWERRKTECKGYWLSLTLINKVKWLSTAMSIVYLSSFLVM
ncbi:MAG: hypothetical protein PHU14_16820 [Methylovulum sp.]|nr:hypothetical protein [Methylovulum sp.]